MVDDNEANKNELSCEDEARRRLLKLVVYGAPAILGTLLVSGDARAQTPSCTPAGCAPNSSCLPNTDPGCGPAACKPRQ